MTSVPLSFKRRRVVNILNNVLGVPTAADRSRLLALIASDGEVEESVAKIEDLCSGSLGSYTSDELQTAGKLRLGGVGADGSLTSVDSWGKLMQLSWKGDDLDEALRALIDHNIECGKIITAFRAQASRYLGSNEKLSETSITRHNTLKNKVAMSRASCADSEKMLQVLKGRFKDSFSLPELNKKVVQMAFDHPGSNTDIFDKLDQRELFDEWTSPYDHILTKLQVLGAELKYNDEGDNVLLSNARRCASEVVWSFFCQCRRSLSNVYLEASMVKTVDVDDAPTHARAIQEERRALTEEIQSLWEEVVPVAHMAVENQFLKPFLRAVHVNQRDAKRRNATMAAYISGVLRYMNQRLQVLTKRIYQAATYRDDSPSSIITLLQDYLATFGSIPIEIESDHPKRQPAEQVVTKLQEFVASRNVKLSAMYEQMQDLFEAAARANLGNVEIGRAILSRRIAADGSSGMDVPRVVHRDEEAEEAIRLMEDEVEVVRERFRRLGQTGPANAPDFILNAYLKTHKRLSAKHLEGCLNSQTLHFSCPTCHGCTKFTDFIERWGDA
ncbi:hypothetical protein SLS62_008181 [Diatrype stigma]|uniref:Uncharacterized protein n=1 Tax=Diatrype stigma TaxID=117547 RepID=A0AAN9YP80_9PEZI